MQNYNKTFVLLFLGVLLSFLTLSMLFYLRFSPQSNKTTTIIPTITPVQNPSLTKKTTISGVEVNNIMLSPIQKNDDGDVEFAKTNSYSITYLPAYKQFLITILSLPFDTARKDAETALLQKLGVKEQDACILNVVIDVPFFVDPALSDKTYPLSFCSNQ